MSLNLVKMHLVVIQVIKLCLWGFPHGFGVVFYYSLIILIYIGSLEGSSRNGSEIDSVLRVGELVSVGRL